MCLMDLFEPPKIEIKGAKIIKRFKDTWSNTKRKRPSMSEKAKEGRRRRHQRYLENLKKDSFRLARRKRKARERLAKSKEKRKKSLMQCCIGV